MDPRTFHKSFKWLSYKPKTRDQHFMPFIVSTAGQKPGARGKITIHVLGGCSWIKNDSLVVTLQSANILTSELILFEQEKWLKIIL